MSKLAIAGELWHFARRRRKWWLLPLLLLFLALGMLVLFAETSALAPFIYSVY